MVDVLTQTDDEVETIRYHCNTCGQHVSGFLLDYVEKNLDPVKVTLSSQPAEGQSCQPNGAGNKRQACQKKEPVRRPGQNKTIVVAA